MAFNITTSIPFRANATAAVASRQRRLCREYRRSLASILLGELGVVHLLERFADADRVYGRRVFSVLLLVQRWRDNSFLFRRTTNRQRLLVGVLGPTYHCPRASTGFGFGALRVQTHVFFFWGDPCSTSGTVGALLNSTFYVSLTHHALLELPSTLRVRPHLDLFQKLSDRGHRACSSRRSKRGPRGEYRNVSIKSKYDDKVLGKHHRGFGIVAVRVLVS